MTYVRTRNMPTTSFGASLISRDSFIFLTVSMEWGIFRLTVQTEAHQSTHSPSYLQVYDMLQGSLKLPV